MSRVALGLVVAAGCGRVSFDRTMDAATDAPFDAPMLADCTSPASDGLACDDRNICTSESTCKAGACVPTMPMATCVVTDSEMDFDTVQGVGGWFYGYWTAETDPTYEPATDFVEAVWAGSSYVTPSTTFTYLAWWGAHPAWNPVEYAIRRWVSTVQGPATIDVRAAKSDIDCGDGTRASLLVDGVEHWAFTVAFNDNTGMSATVDVELRVGSYVEFLLAPVGGDACDSTETSFVVRSPQ